MKRITILFSLLVFFSTGVQAQKKYLVYAETYIKERKLDQARKAIDAAYMDKETNYDPSTWIHFGEIFLYECSGFGDFEPDLHDYRENGLTAYKSLRKALEFDVDGNHKEKISALLEKLMDSFSFLGFLAVDYEDYSLAIDNYKSAIEVSGLNGMVNIQAMLEIASVSEMKGDLVTSAEYYKKVIQYQPDNFGVVYNLAAIYINIAVSLIEEADNVPLDENDKYKILVEKANEQLRIAIPYLERALEIGTGDDYNMIVVNRLREIYSRLEMSDKLDQLNQQYK